MRLFLVCLGGAVGSGARYIVSLLAIARFGTSFPAGTLIVNVAGSFLIGLIMQLSLSHETRLMLTAGVMGGFTTYSAFNYETTSLLREGAWMIGFANVAATLLGCFIAGLAGLALGRLIAR